MLVYEPRDSVDYVRDQTLLTTFLLVIDRSTEYAFLQFLLYIFDMNLILDLA